MTASRLLFKAILVVALALVPWWGIVSARGGTIEGRVARKLDGVALPKITVKLFDGKWQVLRSTMSDNSGAYVFGGLAEGQYYLQAVSDRTYAGRFSGDADSRKDAAPVTVLRSESSHPIDLLLQRWGSVSGRVVSMGDRRPVAHVQIRVYDRGWRPLRSVRTDGSGVFSVDQLGGGRYYLLTWNDQGLVDVAYPGHPLLAGIWPPERGESVKVELDADTGAIDLALHPGGTIFSTTTRDSDGAPLEVIRIVVLTPGLAVVRETASDATGAFAISGLPEGSYHVRTFNTEGFVDVFQDGAPDAESAKLVEAQRGANKVPVNFKLVVGGVVTGRVTDLAGTGIPNVELLLCDRSWRVKGSGVSDGQGSYRIAGMAPGAYRLKTASGPGTIDHCYGSDQSCVDPQPVVLQSGRVTPDINLSLAPAGMLSGRVIDRSSGTGLRRVYLSVYDGDWNFVAGDEVDLHGAFSIGKLPEGAYYVQATNSEGYGEVYYPDARSREGASLVTIIPRRDPGFIRLVLDPRPTAIHP